MENTPVWPAANRAFGVGGNDAFRKGREVFV